MRSPDTLGHLLLSTFGTSELEHIAEDLRQEIIRRQTGVKGPLIHIPLSIFSGVLAPAESLVKYLKEESSLTFAQIGKLLHRDERGIWSTYQRAIKKLHGPSIIKEDSPLVPLSIFCTRELSVLEALVLYLVKNKGYTLKQCQASLEKSYSTVSTAYRRAKLKPVNEIYKNQTKNKESSRGGHEWS